MCLAVPMKVIEINGYLGMAEVGRVKREINLMLLDDVKIGDYVIVHAGSAIQKLDEAEAEKTLSLLREMVEKTDTLWE
ncbi:MAG: hydrogenase assembly protein HupF [Nitrospinae bacterium RIFCSPLOWO2_01_FULL_39_10]|nr:MAG: hydrogenase assembly protein HupF [Nitrospinae bacterium RIFCSPLOWO2_01_FULL_39_10]